jgi:hypothetical protein
MWMEEYIDAAVPPSAPRRPLAGVAVHGLGGR